MAFPTREVCWELGSKDDQLQVAATLAVPKKLRSLFPEQCGVCESAAHQANRSLMFSLLPEQIDISRPMPSSAAR